jgi:hypothetical protein
MNSAIVLEPYGQAAHFCLTSDDITEVFFLALQSKSEILTENYCIEMCYLLTNWG